jgi:glyoxalase family protein
VKKTVNYDDPFTYHLYYGDGVGSPGTLITFFPWAKSFRGRTGAGVTNSTSYAVPKGSLAAWNERLTAAGVTFATPTASGESRLAVLDPDGLTIELVESESAEATKIWARGGVSENMAIRGFHSVTLLESAEAPTASYLVNHLGFTRKGEVGSVVRFVSGEERSGQIVDVQVDRSARRGNVAVGAVHHIAFRTPTDETELQLRSELLQAGVNVSPVMDRTYFHSIYFREPGGVLFEVATDPPGFTKDESVEGLGGSLVLPSWLESDRQTIETRLQRLTTGEVRVEVRQ